MALVQVSQYFFKKRVLNKKRRRSSGNQRKRNVAARQLTAEQIIRLQKRRLVEGEHMFSWAQGRKRQREGGSEIKRLRWERTNKRCHSVTARVQSEQNGAAGSSGATHCLLAARLPHQPTISCGRTDDDVTTGRHPAGLARASLSHFHDILIRANTYDHQRAAQELFPLFSFLSMKQNKNKIPLLVFVFLIFTIQFCKYI